MALKTALAAQVGLVKEVTYGTYVAPTRFIEFVSESMKQEIDRVESKAIRANSRVMRSDDWASGTKGVSGDVELELWNKSFGLIFELMIGGSAVTTTATGSMYTHTFTPGDLASATIQAGVPDIGGTVRPFSYTGCMVNEWELSSTVGDPVMVKLGVVGQAETTAQSLASASYATGLELLTFVGGNLSIAGTGVPVNKVTLKGNNGLATDRYFLGSANRSQPLEADLREYSGDFEAEFTDLTAYNRYVNGTEAALVLTFAGVANPTHKLVVTCNVRFDGETPTVGGTGIVTQPMSFKAVASSTDASALTLAYSTPDATV